MTFKIGILNVKRCKAIFLSNLILVLHSLIIFSFSFNNFKFISTSPWLNIFLIQLLTCIVNIGFIHCANCIAKSGCIHIFLLSISLFIKSIALFFVFNSNASINLVVWSKLIQSLNILFPALHNWVALMYPSIFLNSIFWLFRIKLIGLFFFVSSLIIIFFFYLLNTKIFKYF